MQKLRGAAATGIAIAFLAASPAPAADGRTIGKVDLSGSERYPNSSGQAMLEIHPRHAQVDLDRLHGLPRKPHVIFVVWLVTGKDEGYIGGAFPRSSAPHGLDAIVPGRTVISHRNTRAADRVVLTVMGRERARRLGRIENRAGWTRRVEIVGERVLQGSVSP